VNPSSPPAPIRARTINGVDAAAGRRQEASRDTRETASTGWTLAMAMTVSPDGKALSIGDGYSFGGTMPGPSESSRPRMMVK